MAEKKKSAATTTTTTTTTTASENLYMQLNASELSAIIMKGSPHSNDRDAGFCSGSSEGGDDLSMDHSRLDPSSPADASEDSVEVKVTPIALIRNKRKSSEPSKVICEREEATGPLKKRIRYTSTADSAVVVLTPPATAAHTPPPTPTPTSTPTPTPTPSPMPTTTPTSSVWLDPSGQRLPHELMPNPAQVFVRHPGVTTLHRLPLGHGPSPAAAAAAIATSVDDVQQEPLALVLKKPSSDAAASASATAGSPPKSRRLSLGLGLSHSQSQSPPQSQLPSAHIKLELEPRDEPAATERKFESDRERKFESDLERKYEAELETRPLPTRPEASPSVASSMDEGSLQNLSGSSGSASGSRPHQRNYKNMTRERRIEANARERTRVHTISAAYETLRKAVPSYSNSQKLSKLSVLRVACSYILTLSRMAGLDYSEDQSEPSIASCFEAVTATIQTEGKIRKKKDE